MGGDHPPEQGGKTGYSQSVKIGDSERIFDFAIALGRKSKKPFIGLFEARGLRRSGTDGLNHGD